MRSQPTRFSQAQVLIAALFAVVFTGKMPDEQEPKMLKRPPSSNKIRRRSEFSRGGRYEGVHAEVAKELGVTKRHVSNVMYGQKKSAHISKALQLAIAKRDRQPPIPPPQLTRRQSAQLRNGKRYEGLRMQVAKDLNLTKSIVYGVVMGSTYSARVTQALLDAMARRDAELAKQVSR